MRPHVAMFCEHEVNYDLPCDECAAKPRPWPRGGAEAPTPTVNNVTHVHMGGTHVEVPSVGVTKDTNPKDAVGSLKAPISTVSAPVIAEVGVAMLEGARKYGRHNYRVAGVRASVYYDAAVNRHLGAWWEGEDLDVDSGLSHITKAIAGLVVLRDSMIQGNWVDDRPPPSPKGWLAQLNKKVAEIIAKYPDAKEAFMGTDTKADTDRKLGRAPVAAEVPSYVHVHRNHPPIPDRYRQVVENYYPVRVHGSAPAGKMTALRWEESAREGCGFWQCLIEFGGEQPRWIHIGNLQYITPGSNWAALEIRS